MNLRNRKVVLTVRTLLGLFILFSGVTGFMAAMNNMQGIPPEMIPYMKVLWGSGIFQMIKTTEIVAGLMLLFGFLPQLALLALAPLCVGVLVFNSQVAPMGLVAGGIVTAMTAYLGYSYFDTFYRPLFQRS